MTFDVLTVAFCVAWLAWLASEVRLSVRLRRELRAINRRHAEILARLAELHAMKGNDA